MELIRETIQGWSKAVELHSSGRYAEAIECYSEIKHMSARMYYNRACAEISLELIDEAIQSLSHAIGKDRHLAVAYFQRGTLHLQNHNPTKAIADLEMSRTLLRGNSHINYKPLGLYTWLSSCQILQNLSLAYISAERLTDARRLLTEAIDNSDDHQRNTIQTCLEKIDNSHTELFPVTKVSVDKVFTLPKYVTRNLEKKGIVRRAKVVSAVDTDDRNAAFEGSKRVRELKQNSSPAVDKLKTSKGLDKERLRLENSSRKCTESKGLKPSKSMSDLYAKDTSFLSESCSPFVGILRLIQKIASSSPTHKVTNKVLNNKKKNHTDVTSCEVRNQESKKFGVISTKNKGEKSVFGQTSSPLSDVRTAVVAPTLYANDDSKTGTHQDLKSEDCKESLLENVDKSILLCLKNIQDTNANTIGSGEGKEDLLSLSPRKSRPPPPSYPPPPLPQNIIIFV